MLDTESFMRGSDTHFTHFYYPINPIVKVYVNFINKIRFIPKVLEYRVNILQLHRAFFL